MKLLVFFFFFCFVISYLSLPVLTPVLTRPIYFGNQGRAGKQCRERWFNHLDPSIRKTPWTEEEDQLILQLHAEKGNRWAEIAKHPGSIFRSPHSF
jgi:hypothetical protein